MTDEPTNRRGLLKALLRTAGEALSEYTDAVNATTAPFEEAAAAMRREEEAPPPPPELEQVTPATRCLTVDELLALAAEEGLGGRGDALRALARATTLLTPTLGVGGDRSFVGRPADAVRADGTLVAVAEIELADPALEGGELAGAGRLVAMIVAPHGAPLPRCGRAHVRVEPETTVTEGAPGRAVHLSTALVLPRVWAAPVQALALDETEQAAYVRLRERVAEAQGVTVEDGDAEGVARHHALGYPTETSGAMPLACELAARGLDPDAPAADAPPDAAAAAERWRLLLQITQDERSGVTLGRGAGRLFFWIAADRLARRDFSEVWVLAR
jgi:hypothetical protein